MSLCLCFTSLGSSLIPYHKDEIRRETFSDVTETIPETYDNDKDYDETKERKNNEREHRVIKHVTQIYLRNDLIY